jgi:hypothetical protein
MKEMETETGEKHGLINMLANSVPFDDFAKMDPKTKAECQKMKAHDSKIVKARYINHRGANERLSRPYMRWAGDPIQMWNFIPDQEYEVPRGLVDEVNDKRRIPKKMSGLLDANGKALLVDQPGQRIHEFVAVGF